MDPYIFKTATNYGAGQIHVCTEFAKTMSKLHFAKSKEFYSDVHAEKYFMDEFVKCANYLSTSTTKDLRNIRFE
jgi:hypothetical protein